MHELSLMMQLAEIAEEEARRHGGEAIERIRVRIGSLSGVDPEALMMAGEVVCSEGILAGAHLELEIIEARAFCIPCNISFEVSDGVCLCPRCGTISPELLQGGELELASLQLRLPAESAQP